MRDIKRISNMKEVKSFRTEPGRRLYSASHEEIIDGLTTDVYFVKTKEILEDMGLADTVVTAEVFPRDEGILAGVGEVLALFEGMDLEVWSLKEGDSFKAKDTVMRIIGKYSDFGIYETALLGILASSSAWATAARQIREAAGDKTFISFGARHLHPSVAPVMERAAMVGGADGASCILAAKLMGKDPKGTCPHAAFLVAGDTVSVAKKYDEIMPAEEARIILIDTFKDETEEALNVARALGDRLKGIRLDTPGERGGVTAGLVRETRARLDQAGFKHVQILVSGGLNPDRVRLLAEAGADSFGVGSYISAAKPIDMTMDLKEVGGRPIAKRGRIPGRIENPGLVRFI